MSDKKYYLPIQSANLAHYFSKGCVCPTKYLQNRNDDIQNKFENQLLLSDTKFTNETNCSLELVFDEKFEKIKQITNNFYLFDSPIPISRVKKIIFQQERQKINTTFDITSGAAFLPSEIIEVDSTSVIANTAELLNVKSETAVEDWSEKLELFDKLLGGYAIMSIAGNEFQNYSLNYFNTLGVLNSLVKEELNKQSIEVTHNYDWAILDTGKHVDLHKAVYSRIDKALVEEFAKKDNIKLETSNGKYVIDKIRNDKTVYLIAILASYGEGNAARMTIDTFISDFLSNKFPDEKKEGLALIFGINKGYEIFRNKYRTQSFEVDIKFKLDSQLDYYTIESIYQFAFNNKTNNRRFDYIDNWCLKHKDSIVVKNFETYKILDKTIIYKKKEETESQDFYQPFYQIFQNTSRNKIYQKITTETSKYIPPYAKNRDNIEGDKYFMNLLEDDFKEYTKIVYDKVKEQMINVSNSKYPKLNEENTIEIEKLKNTIKVQNNKIIELEEKLEIKNESISIKKTLFNSLSNSDNTNGAVLFPLESIDKQSSRRIELEKLGIRKLRSEGKKIGISAEYNNTPIDKEKLIDNILQMESSKS